MYAYYAGTIQGLSLGAVKWLMTFLQICQLVFGTATSFWYPMYQRGYRENELYMAGFYLSTFYTGSLVLLFSNFFYRAYIAPSKRPSSAAAKGKRKSE